MKILVIILKVLILIATGVCGIVFNLFGSISMLTMGQAEDYGIVPQITFWHIFTIICYIIPTFLMMFKEYIVSAAMSFAGMICVLVLNELLSGAGNELYLQLLIITILMIILAIFGSWDKIHSAIDNRHAKQTAAAPSVLGGTTKADDISKNNNRKKQSRNATKNFKN